MGLIFDLGMHRGLDTKFYLDKGFHVIALEANPALCQQARNTFAPQLSTGQLTIVERALADRSGEHIKFYVNNVKDDWSSVSKKWAEKGGHASVEIEVETITLMDLVAQHGTPYYVKCDIEGSDAVFCKQVRELGMLPDFSSVEAIGETVLLDLKEAGYNRFQIVNQAFSGWVKPPNPPREGKFVEVQFNGHMSGLFGAELDEGKWIPYDECLERFRLFSKLRQKDPNLAHGWLDFHAGR